MALFLHQLASGLALGGIYAIMALALVMIYQATQLVNFAQGEMAMFSTYLAWKMVDSGWRYWAAFAATLLKISSRPMNTITTLSVGAPAKGRPMSRSIATPPRKDTRTVSPNAAQ